MMTTPVVAMTNSREPMLRAFHQLSRHHRRSGLRAQPSAESVHADRGRSVRYDVDVHTRSVSEDLPIPAGLQALIDAGVWPTVESANSQNLRSLVTPDDVERVAPGERSLFLDPPPFRRLAREVATNPEFWGEHGALDQIDPELAQIVGDCGLGSDTAIVLDYRPDRRRPSVQRLAWNRDGNQWVEVAPNFEEFACMLRLG